MNKGVYMIKQIVVVSTVFLSLFCVGCATLFKGYTSEVEIMRVPRNITVTTSDGIKLETSYKQRNRTLYKDGYKTGHEIFTDSNSVFFQLRSNKDQIIILKNGESESRYYVYPKLSPWWMILDCFFAGVPAVVDGITGNWFYFDPMIYK